MTDYKALLTGYPIYIATKEIQRRKHHKKRINKKWLKRYGMIELNSLPHGEVIMMDNGVIYMTKRTLENLKKSIGLRAAELKRGNECRKTKANSQYLTQ